jgi:DNA repair protein RadC
MFQLNESTGRYTGRGQVNAKAIIEQAKRIVAKRLTKSGFKPLTSPDAVRQFLQRQLADRERDSFACLLLDNRHRLIAYEELFHGTIDGASFQPREVVKSALRYNSAAVILAHNHPQGVAEPSLARPISASPSDSRRP